LIRNDAPACVVCAPARRRFPATRARPAKVRICAQPVCKDFIVKDCSTWLDQVQTSLPTVVPVATDQDGNNLPGVRVSMDGRVLLDAIDGRSIEVDPGTHTFSFEAPDGMKADKEIVVAEGEKSKHVAVVLARPRPAQAVAPVAAATPAPSAAMAPVDVGAPQESHHGPWKTVGIVTTAVGGVVLTVGGIFGVEAMSKKSDAGCNGLRCASSDGVAKLQSAQTDGSLSTGFFIAGGVPAAAGLTIWVLAPGEVQAAPSVGVGSAGAVVRGAF
jgi:hypothetical protein